MNDYRARRRLSTSSPSAAEKRRRKEVFTGRPDGRKVEWVAVASLQPHPNNPRTHSSAQIRQLVQSIREFGWIGAIYIDQRARVIAGHARLEAARMLGFERVPVIRLEHLTEAQLRAYIIADNKLAENAGWDQHLLATELQFLSSLDLDFDATVTGFETGEIDFLIQGLDSPGVSGADDDITSIDRSTPAVTQVGDLWFAGDHRLLCADATKQESYRRLLRRKKAQVIFLDPPYNVPIDGHVCGLGSIKHREFPMATGEMSEIEFEGFLRATFGNLVAFSIDGSIHFICMDWRHLFELLTAARGIYSEFKNLCVWNKDNGGMGSLYRSKHELVAIFKNGTAAHINNVELGRFGRNRTNVWNYPGANSSRDGRRDELALHPTVKPVALIADAILDCSKRGGIVLDTFGGSGTTILAAEKTGRRAYTMELDPIYVDTAIGRFERLTGEQAIHSVTGLTFAEMRLERPSRAPAATEKQTEEEEVEDVGRR